MNVLVIDCEYNQLNDNPKTIQIGAAAYKAKTGELLGEFETFIDPNECIVPRITELTGITTADVSGAPNIREAYEELQRFAQKHKCFKNPLLWGAGTSNDSAHIYQEAYPTKELQKEHHNFMGRRVIDVKSIWQSIQIHNNDTVKGGLVAVCDKIGIGFEGNAHTALADAKNTFRVWYFLVKQFPQRFR